MGRLRRGEGSGLSSKRGPEVCVCSRSLIAEETTKREMGVAVLSCGRKGSTVSFWGARSSGNVVGTRVGFQGVWDGHVGGESSRTRELARKWPA